MSNSPRLGLPMLAVGQAQKEFLHNEALQTIDTLIGTEVQSVPGNTPPTTPAAGQVYIVGTAPTGAWSGKARHIAAYSAGGWRFIAPVDGLSATIKSNGTTITYRAGAWEQGIVRANAVLINGVQIVGPRVAAIADPTGGSNADTEARSTIAAILAALRSHGLISA